MRDHPNALMIFAAGFGTRMRSLTADCPKPLIQVDGKPLIDHTLDLAAEIAPNPIVANLHYLPDQLEQHLTPRGVQCIREEPDILDTGGGLREALPLLGRGPVFTSNSDAIWKGPNPFQCLKDAWDPDRMDALLLCTPLEKTHGHGGNGDFLISEDGQLRRGPGVVYGGVQIIKPDGLHSIESKSFSLNILWNHMIKNERLFGLTYPGEWCDVGTPEGIHLAEALVRSTDV